LRILIASPSLPHPPQWGFGIRVRKLLEGLAARHDVSLLAYAGPDEAAKVSALSSSCAELLTVAMPKAPAIRDHWQHARALASRHSYHFGHLRSAAYQSALDEACRRTPFDFIQVESSALAGFRFQAPVVLDEHNIESELLWRTAREERSPWRRLLRAREAQQVEREELDSWRRVAACVVTSEREVHIVRKAVPQKPCRVVPNGVDSGYFVPAGTAVEADTFVFTGLMSYRPNADGVAYFIEQVLPLIRRVRPAARFIVVGWGGTRLHSLSGPGITFTGRVADVRHYLARAAAVVTPLRVGSGTRLKVLEALAMAKPVVSTSVGCEGIDVVDGQHLLVADTPAAFAEAVLRVLADSDLARRLGSAGRELVQDRYSWRSSAEALCALYDELGERSSLAGRVRA
jgi:sugar transferase (PEP-CTERM/EpsH1 system associated)